MFGQLAAAVANEVDRLWADDWDMDAMVITGGGGAVLSKYLQPLLNGRVLPVDSARDARLSNVRGLLEIRPPSLGKGRPAGAGQPMTRS